MIGRLNGTGRGQVYYRFSPEVQKEQHKAWHDRNIKRKWFQLGNLVLMYDSKFLKHPRKLEMHWMGPYRIEHITYARVVKLSNLDGELREGMVNANLLRPYSDTHTAWQEWKKKIDLFCFALICFYLCWQLIEEQVAITMCWKKIQGHKKDPQSSTNTLHCIDDAQEAHFIEERAMNFMLQW